MMLSPVESDPPGAWSGRDGVKNRSYLSGRGLYKSLSSRKAIRPLLIYGSATGCLLAALTWLIGAIWRGREAALSARMRRQPCTTRELCSASTIRPTAVSHLPTSFDRSGKPLYSWRVVLMAYLEREEGVERSAAHRKIQVRRVMGQPSQPLAACRRDHLNFFCPGFPEGAQKGYTSFVAVVGRRTLFPSHGRTRRLADVRDDPTSTLMIVESVNTSIHWMEPRDLEWDRMSFSVNDRSRPSISSEHRVFGVAQGTSLVLAADGGLAYLGGIR